MLQITRPSNHEPEGKLARGQRADPESQVDKIGGRRYLIFLPPPFLPHGQTPLLHPALHVES